MTASVTAAPRPTFRARNQRYRRRPPSPSAFRPAALRATYGRRGTAATGFRRQRAASSAETRNQAPAKLDVAPLPSLTPMVTTPAAASSAMSVMVVRAWAAMPQAANTFTGSSTTLVDPIAWRPTWRGIA